MSKKDFSLNLIKARVAETIIQQLFIENGYSVFHYGMENAVPTIVGRLNKDNSEISKSIRQMPDFVLQSPDGELFYLEVKYRAKGDFFFEEITDSFPYKNAWFIIVTKDQMFCASVSELKKYGKIPLEDTFHLNNRTEFLLSVDAVNRFKDIAGKFFKGV